MVYLGQATWNDTTRRGAGFYRDKYPRVTVNGWGTAPASSEQVIQWLEATDMLPAA
jgi:hypothetical protein